MQCETERSRYWWVGDIDETHSDGMRAVCSSEDAQKQSTCPPQNFDARARSVLEKLIRLSLTNKLTDDQTKAVVELGNQLFQSSGSISTARRVQSAVVPCSSMPCEVTCHQPQSQASLLAAMVVQQTVSRIRIEVAATAVQRRSTASMLADAVVQQTLRELTNDLMTSDVLSPRAVVSDKAVQVAPSSSSTAGAACPPAVCTELTKYIVMNAVDIALSCARRAAAKQATTPGDKEPPPVSQFPRRAEIRLKERSEVK